VEFIHLFCRHGKYQKKKEKKEVSYILFLLIVTKIIPDDLNYHGRGLDGVASAAALLSSTEATGGTFGAVYQGCATLSFSCGALAGQSCA
jgi:hypothetical protein